MKFAAEVLPDLKQPRLAAMLASGVG
jgi:hypothetical protein